MQEIEEKMCRGMNLLIRDESEDEDEVEENVNVEAILDPKEEGFLGPSPRLEKDLSLRFSYFLEILSQRS